MTLSIIFWVIFIIALVLDRVNWRERWLVYALIGLLGWAVFGVK